MAAGRVDCVGVSGNNGFEGAPESKLAFGRAELMTPRVWSFAKLSTIFH